MIVWALLTETGCIETCGISRHPPAGHVEMPAGEGNARAPFLRYVEGVWVSRPLPPEPVVSGNTVTIPGAPEGMVVKVLDPETRALFRSVEEDGGSIVLTLGDAGDYVLQAICPEPYVTESEQIVTIEDTL